MGLIKSANMPATVSPFSMRDIEAQAASILGEARKEAQRIVAAARTEGQAILQRSAAQGLAEGRQQGIALGMEEGHKTGHAQALAEHAAAMTQLIEALTATARQLDENRQLLHTQAVREVVDLACAVARRVTKRQAALDPEILSANLKEAMTLAVHAADVRIALHPSQLQKLQEELPNLRLSWPQLKHVELVADESVAPGGVRIHSQHAQVDGQLDTQLDRIIHELMPGGVAEIA